MGDVHELRTSPGKFDAVLMLEVLENVDEPDRALEVVAGLTNSHVVVSVPGEPVLRGPNQARARNILVLMLVVGTIAFFTRQFSDGTRRLNNSCPLNARQPFRAR